MRGALKECVILATLTLSRHESYARHRCRGTNRRRQTQLRSLPYAVVHGTPQLAFNTAAKPPRASSADGVRQDPMAAAMNMMTQMMERQTHLMEQFSLQQRNHRHIELSQEYKQQSTSQAPGDTAQDMDANIDQELYQNPDSLLQHFDPDVRKLFRAWYKEAKGLLNSWAT